ncbi:MAG: enoyl-CoA hydratase/isomerase family protein [Acidobacteria bacterium]|nr:enoyl-CoA hydratase/isomerase family protein [Acidobacteriota bacterium]
MDSIESNQLSQDHRHYQGDTLSWELSDGVIELALHREPCNEIGTRTVEELELFVSAHDVLCQEAHSLIIYSRQTAGFCAGADLRELYREASSLGFEAAAPQVRVFLERIHRVMNTLDGSPLVTIAAINGLTFGGGLELALVCDLIFAEKMARFCFPELRLGLIPGFGGIPRLRRDLGNGIVRDLLLTGRSINAGRAQAVGLVSQLVGEGEALRVARITAAQIGKFDRTTIKAAKRFVKPIPYDELRTEIDIFIDLFTRPATEAGLRKFVESTAALPYLP